MTLPQSLFLKLVLVAFIVFFIIDLIWLGLIAKNLYRDNLGHLLADKTNWIAALIFYVLYIIGLTYFVIYPAAQKGDIVMALMNGAFFGLIGYATYDLTNLATLNQWPLKITIIDLIWGTVLGGSISAITVWISNLWLKQ